MPEFESKVPTLYIFSGLPGSGKSTLSQLVARQLKAVYLRIDTIEQGLRELCSLDVQGEGYRLAYRIALDNLRLGVSVVADSCNPIQLTRREWEQVARDARAEYINIEIVCSDSNEHRLRAESRVAGVSGLRLPTWSEIENREYDVWTVERVIVDTAGRSEAECARDLFSKLTPARAESVIATGATRRHVDEVDMQSDEKQIRTLVQTWQSATKAGDIDAVLSLMVEDVVFLVPGRSPMNKAEFAALSRVAGGGPRPKIESISEIQEIQVSGDMAYLWSKLGVTVTAPGASQPMERAGYTLTVFRRVGGKWLLARDANLLSPALRPST